MDKTVLIIAGSAVILPLVIGVLLGQIPKEIFITWALPLAAATLGLLFAIRYIEQLDPTTRFIASVGFGLLWLIGGGITLSRTSTAPHRPTAAESVARRFGWMFLLFGLVWIGVSAYQYYRTRG